MKLLDIKHYILYFLPLIPNYCYILDNKELVKIVHTSWIENNKLDPHVYFIVLNAKNTDRIFCLSRFEFIKYITYI